MLKASIRQGALKAFACGALALLISGCMTVQLVGDYDENIDTGATGLQHKLSEFFVGLQSAGANGLTFSASQDFYKSAAADVDALEVRAAAIRKNEITSQQLQLVEDNLAMLALMHKHCITGSITEEQREKIRSSGVDASEDCRSDFGASIDDTGRGGQKLNPATIGNLKNQFEQSLGAVIALEVAKKRGKKE